MRLRRPYRLSPMPHPMLQARDTAGLEATGTLQVQGMRGDQDTGLVHLTRALTGLARATTGTPTIPVTGTDNQCRALSHL